MSEPIDLEDIPEPLPAIAEVGDATDFVRISQENFDEIEAAFNALQARVDAGQPAQANINTFTAPSLTGLSADVRTFITTGNVIISYGISTPADLTSLLLIMNGVEIPIELPRPDSGLVSDFTVPITASSRNAIAAAITNDEIISFLQGIRTDSSVVESPRLTLVEGLLPFTNALYFGIIDDDSIDLFSFNNDQRIDFDENSQADISLGPFPEGNPQTDGRGQFAAFSFPFIQDLQLVSVTNNDVLDLDETAAFGRFGGLRSNNNPDDRTWEVFTAGPIVPGVTLNLRVTVRGLP